MHPKILSIKDFTYHLPDEKIAFHPLTERDSSKLLVYKDGKIKTDIFRNLANYITEDSILVFNNTKVVEARLFFQKDTGGVIEIFCLEPHEQYPDITTAMLQKEKVLWQCLVGGASKWKPGQVLGKNIRSGNGEIVLKAKYIEKRTNSFIIELSWKNDLSFAEVLHLAGAIPLPPYIKRSVEESDKKRYQTVYANTEGSVAAPTAGLHFTEKIFHELDNLHVVREYVTLHVGAGTFKPVKSEVIQDHTMHAEWIDVSKRFLENLLHDIEEPIIAVGTTSLRTIESLYWIGVSLKLGVWSSESRVNQWTPYENVSGDISPQEALTLVLNWMENKKLEKLITKTQIMIAPGYKPRIAKGLITNFHQPQSTLLLLVAALIGNDWRKVYDYALQNNFRFLSYGDGSLLFF